MVQLAPPDPISDKDDGVSGSRRRRPAEDHAVRSAVIPLRYPPTTRTTAARTPWHHVSLRIWAFISTEQGDTHPAVGRCLRDAAQQKSSSWTEPSTPHSPTASLCMGPRGRGTKCNRSAEPTEVTMRRKARLRDEASLEPGEESRIARGEPRAPWLVRKTPTARAPQQPEDDTDTTTSLSAEPCLGIAPPFRVEPDGAWMSSISSELHGPQRSKKIAA